MADSIYVKLEKERENLMELTCEVPVFIGAKELAILEKKAEILGTTAGLLFRYYAFKAGLFEDVFTVKKVKKPRAKTIRCKK